MKKERFDSVNPPLSEIPQRGIRVRGLGRDDYNPITGLPHSYLNAELNGEWERFPERDKRIHRGDDYSGDAWREKATDQINWVAVNHIPSYARKK